MISDIYHTLCRLVRDRREFVVRKADGDVFGFVPIGSDTVWRIIIADDVDIVVQRLRANYSMGSPTCWLEPYMTDIILKVLVHPGDEIEEVDP